MLGEAQADTEGVRQQDGAGSTLRACPSLVPSIVPSDLYLAPAAAHGTVWCQQHWWPHIGTVLHQPAPRGQS